MVGGDGLSLLPENLPKSPTKHRKLGELPPPSVKMLVLSYVNFTIRIKNKI